MKKGRVKNQCSFYGTREIIKDILEEAHKENLSFSDYLIKLHKSERVKFLDEEMEIVKTAYSNKEISWEQYTELLQANDEKINNILGE